MPEYDNPSARGGGPRDNTGGPREPRLEECPLCGADIALHLSKHLPKCPARDRDLDEVEDMAGVSE